MSDTDVVIRVEGLGKKYTLLHEKSERYTTLRDVMARQAKAAGRLLNPFTLSGQLRKAQREAAQERTESEEEFWALKDVSFEIRRGESVGIIGRNGAGKSTLLKILSRITEPTTGRVEIRGRVSSLLEVGTGFHPELTGRENIYLNGAILGMTRREIHFKFNEIVNFAEVNKFLDTPVKRYSSGMYVRLAFAVAAHLEPEILIIDEVLAVGDAQFQRKCLGKMESVSHEGRAVLFVSHSMPSITSFCDRAILLDSGKISENGPTSEVVINYNTRGRSSPASADYSQENIGDSTVRLLKGEVKNACGESIAEVPIEDPFWVEMTFEVLYNEANDLTPNYHFYTATGECAFIVHDTHTKHLNAGKYLTRCHVPGNFLNEGGFNIGLAITSFRNGVKVHFYEKACLSFNVTDQRIDIITRPGHGKPIPGVVRPLLEWEMRKL